MHYRLHYGGRLVATGADRVRFAPAIEVLERDHPLRRFVAAMCLYLHDVDDGLQPAPANAPAAAHYARVLLVPAGAFAQLAAQTDAELAEHFNVPLSEIAARRADVEFVLSCS
jgi:hypothetical protein